MYVRVFARGQRALSLGLILTVSMAAFEALAVATILPQTARELGGLKYYGWTFTGFMLANLVGIPVSGRAADRHGPVRPFTAGVALFASGLALAGCAGSMKGLVLGRVLQGAGAAALSSVAYVAVARAYAPQAQPRMMALLSSAWVLPGLFGPALAAAIARVAGWRAVFLGLAPAALAAGALAVFGLRGLSPAPAPSPGSSPEAGPAGTAVRDAVLLAAGVTGVLLGLRSAYPAVFGPPGAVLALYALHRLLPAGTLRASAGLPAAIAVLALISLAFFSVEAFLPLSLTDLRRAGTGLAAAALTGGTLAWTGGSWWQARGAGRLGPRSLLRVGLGSMLLGIGGACAVLSPMVPPLLAIPAWSVCGLGMGLAYQVATLAVLQEAPVGQEGQVTAAMQIANALAIALGTGFSGELLRWMSRGDQPAAGSLALVDLTAMAACGVAMLAAGGVGAPARPGGEERGLR